VGMMNESGMDEEKSVVKSLVENGLSESAAIDIYHHFRRMRETTSLFESAQRATEIELDFSRYRLKWQTWKNSCAVSSRL
jgi:cell division FtsZ-interacting protein ZapD